MSETIRTEVREGVVILWLQRGKANALSPEFLGEIHSAVSDVNEPSTRGLVVTAEGGIFCAGLDLVGLFDLTRDEIESVMDTLYQVCRGLFTFPRPVIFALNGHAIAGGGVLSLAADQRLMAQGEGKWGLNEIALGLSVPGWAVEMARYALPRPVLEKVLLGGQIYPAFKALDMGVLDDLVEPALLLERSVSRVVDWTASVEAFADIKSRLRAPTLQAMDECADHGAWLDIWFDESVRARLAEARDRLLGKGKS